MTKFIVTKSENYHVTELKSYDDYEQAKQHVDTLASAHRKVFGDHNSVSKTENSASSYPYKIEITEMTHEAGLITDIYYIKRCEDDLPL